MASQKRTDKNKKVLEDVQTTKEVKEEVAQEITPENAEVEVVEENSEENEVAIQLKNAIAKQEEYLNMAQRVQADFENYKRRNQNVRKEAFDEGAGDFAQTLLSTIDNLERAIDAAKDTTDVSLKEGVEMVYRQLLENFAKRGITPIIRIGEPFDPNLENAVMQGTLEDGKAGTVCEVFQKGYQLDKRVLRHAMVKVVQE